MENFNLKDIKHKKIHFIGIGGISMSALALILKANKFFVQGSDEVANQEVKKLLKKKVKVFVGHNEKNLEGVEVVVVSSAIHDDNVEYQYAIQKGLMIIKRAELLGAIARLYKTVVAVSGSHGKTTATAMLSEIFIAAGQRPTVHIGGILNSIGSNFKLGNKKYFITENCEYMDNFLSVFPDVSVILNIDKDHLDYFGSIDGVKKSFLKYAQNTKDGGINLICGDDKNSKILRNCKNVVRFGFNSNCEIYATNVREYKPGFYSFDVIFEKCNLGNIKLTIVGRHNVLNAVSCVFVSMVCGIEFNVIKNAIENFSGVKRRCELVGKVNGASVFHDYAHHPKQIEKMIAVANRCKSKDGKVIVVFEPHTYSRTKYLLKNFAKSFKGADMVILAPVYSAREQESDGLNSNDLLKETKKFVNISVCLNGYSEISKMLKHIAVSGDIIMILGAGTIEKLPELVVD